MRIKYKIKTKYRSMTIAEMLFSMALIGIFLIISAPLISVRAKTQGQDLASIMCIKNVLAADANETISESACASKPDNPCCKAVKYCRYDQNNACSTLQYYADNGSDTEQTSGEKTLKQVCDQGGREGCKYFVMSCHQDNTTCNNESNDYDLEYYLNLPVSSTSAAKKPIADIAGTLYNEGSPNIVYWVDSGCTCPDINLACYVKGETCASPVASSFQVQLSGPNTTKMLPYGMAVDTGTGDIYLTGDYWWVNSGTGSSAIFMIKMNSSGNMTVPYGFQKFIAGTTTLTHAGDQGKGIGVDSQHNVILGAYTEWVQIMTGTAYDGMGVIKMNSSGNMTAPYGWQYMIKESNRSSTLANLSLDSNNNIYIISRDERDSATTKDMTVVRMDPNGTITLQKKINSTNNGDDYGCDIKVDSSGNMYITGASTNGSTNGYDIVAIKMNAEGNITSPYGWQERINSSNNHMDETFSLALDQTNKWVYITGRSYNGAENDFAILKLNATDGSILNNYRVNSSDKKDDYLFDSVLDSTGNLYVTGFSNTTASDDLVIIKMNSSGNMTSPFGWQMRIANASASLKYDYGENIFVDDSGFIYVSGFISDLKITATGATNMLRTASFYGTTSNADLVLLKMQNSQTNIDNSLFVNVTSPFNNTASPFTNMPSVSYVLSSPYTVFYDPATYVNCTISVSNPEYLFN